MEFKIPVFWTEKERSAFAAFEKARFVSLTGAPICPRCDAITKKGEYHCAACAEKLRREIEGPFNHEMPGALMGIPVIAKEQE